MKMLFTLLLASVGAYTYGQGCVAIRGGAAVCSMNGHDLNADAQPTKWQFNTNYRYFHSFRHYVGKVEQKERVEKQTDVRNWQHSVDLGLVRILNNRWSVAASLPVISNKRSSMYEHYGNTSTSPNARNSTTSFGMGDLRLVVYRWLFDPVKHYKANVQAGLGIKLPTGDYKVMDHFRKNDSTWVLGPVDQSIQLGDGGTGVSGELSGYYQLNRQLSLYGNAYYLINPREHNGVSTARGGTTATTAILYGTDVMSVPDQFMLRAGINYMQGKTSLALGYRLEGIPSKDLVGGSSGFRRPGKIAGLEPGFAYQTRHVQWYATVPIWMVKNRTQSVPDQKRTQLTKTYFQGDAAFSNYGINIGMSYKF